MPFRNLEYFASYLFTKRNLDISLDIFCVLNSFAIIFLSVVLANIFYEVFIFYRNPNQRPKFTLFFRNNPNLLKKPRSILTETNEADTKYRDFLKQKMNLLTQVLGKLKVIKQLNETQEQNRSQLNQTLEVSLRL